MIRPSLVLALFAACVVILSGVMLASAQEPATAPVPPPAPQLAASAPAPGPSPAPQSAPDFAQHVDLGAIERLAVQADGRLKSFASHASFMMNFVTGPRRVDGHAPAFTYLDLMIRSEAYADIPVIFIKNKPMRGQIATLLSAQGIEGEQLDVFIKSGLAKRSWIAQPTVLSFLETQRRDLIRTAKLVGALDSAISVMRPDVLLSELRIVPPPGARSNERGIVEEQWLTLEDFAKLTAADNASLDVAAQQNIVNAWKRLISGWRLQNATEVNAAAASLASLLPQVNAAIYPDGERLSWESWYFRAKNMTWVWLLYLLCLVPLLMSVIYRWSAARWTGLALFLLAFGFHTFAIGLRWYVAQRWPNSNMFEAVTTSAWFGGVCAIVLELIARRSPMRGLFATGSAVASMVALMCAHFMPVSLNANISNMMPVLHDVWLYIHTNVIIFSYALIFMAAVSALIYMLYRMGGGRSDYARVGGAGSLIMTTPTGESYIASSRTAVGQVLDGATMVLMELAFIMLFSGLVMGAIWADHSWGRPWGWDPKEVFALNTFIVLALLVHVRLKTKDKALWTALIALFGAGVMLFNWIVINFYIVGLHSYA
jgi:cytochrome c-type biogenesis protein CcsB